MIESHSDNGDTSSIIDDMPCAEDQYKFEASIISTFSQLKASHGWQHAILHKITNYFPRYKLQTSKGTVVQIEERPSWIPCIAYGIQHVLAMFSGVIVLPLILGYDSNTALFFSGISTIIFFIVTGGKVPSYLGCSGSVTSIILSLTGYQFSPANIGLNPKIALVQGAILILSLAYAFIAIIVMTFGYTWLEYFMPPIVTGTIITSIGLHLSFISYNQITTSSFDTYMAITTAGSIMLISVYAPRFLRRISLLLGTIIGYTIHAICGSSSLKGVPPINFSEIVSSPWIRVPTMYYKLEFNGHAISMMMPILVVLLAENLGHMKAIGSITGRSMTGYLGRAYLGDAISCFVASLGGTIPLTTYAENIGVLSVTQVFSPLVILFAATFAILLSFFAKFSAIVKSIPEGVIGGVTLILYALICVTGIRIWVVNKIDFNDSRNMFVGGVPIILAVVMQTPLTMGQLQLDGIGVATFLSILLYQILQGHDSLKKMVTSIKRQWSNRTHHA